MFIRPIQRLRKLQILYPLTYRFATSTGVNPSYVRNSNVRLQSIKPFSTSSSKNSIIQQTIPAAETEKNSKHSVEYVMRRLESFYQFNGFIATEQLQPLMELLKSDANMQLSAEQGLFILNICGCEMPHLTAEERMSNFQNVWQHLQTSGMITKDHLHVMLHVLQYNRAPLHDVNAFIVEYENHQGSAKEVLSDLLSAAGAAGNVKQATDILTEMRSLKIPLAERDFNSLLLAHARAKDMDGFQTVRDSMHAAGITISTETQSTLINIYLEGGDETKALSILEQYHGQFLSHQIENILRCVNVCSNISQEFVAQLVKELEADYVRGPEVPKALRRVCVEFLQNKKLNYVMTVIDTLPKPNFQDNQDVDTYGCFLLHALFRTNCELTKIIEIASGLEDSNKNARALHIAAEIALRRNPPMVLPIFEALLNREQPLRTHYFWPLMMYNFRRHSEYGILKTLKVMQDFKVECDHQTITQYVLPRMSIILTNPQMALKQMDEMGMKTSLVMTPLISHMLTQSKWFEVASLVDTYTTKIQVSEILPQLCTAAVHVKVTRRYHQFAKLLSALSKKNIDQKQDFVGQFLIELLSTQARIRTNHDSLQRLVGEMRKIGLQLSPAAISSIQTLLVKQENTPEKSTKSLQSINQSLNEMANRSLNSANFSVIETNTSFSFKHPRDMSLDELECHLVELESKKMNTRGVLRRMLQVCVRENRLERAVEIKNKCEALQVQSSPGMVASIFDMYIKLGDAENAQKSLKLLQNGYPGFQIDEHKFIDYASLLISTGKIEIAKELLEERSLKHKIIGGDYILKNIWNLLTNVAQHAANTNDLSTDRNLTRETYAFLQNLGYCRTHNAILGPIVRERLLRGDLPSAIKEFQQLATQYKHTPLQFELLSLLVRLCNGSEDLKTKYNCTVEQAQQLLSEVTDIITQIHGSVNMNSGLLLAFAESGSDNQLRRLLLNPEFRINENLLLRNCEHLGQEGAVQTLLRLARGARGLNRVINEQNIYNMLLNNFIKSNNYEAALNLYDRLEADDDLKISEDFVRTLVNLLKTNNIDIPSNIALRARIV